MFTYNRRKTNNINCHVTANLNVTPMTSVYLSMCVVMLILFNATFNTISVKTWRSVLLVEETGISEENHRPVATESLTNFIT
jgi:hypothetical protein